jgi:hypothetical protein
MIKRTPNRVPELVSYTARRKHNAKRPARGFLNAGYAPLKDHRISFTKEKRICHYREDISIKRRHCFERYHRSLSYQKQVKAYGAMVLCRTSALAKRSRSRSCNVRSAAVQPAGGPWHGCLCQ